MTILELREKRNKAWEAAKAFVETKRVIRRGCGHLRGNGAEGSELFC